jgi:probable HAF family extracellular repeat protein
MKMNKLTFASLLLFASAPLALGQGTYTQIDYPGAVYTVGASINSAGDVVGYYRDTSGNNGGFLLSGGTFTTIDYPGSTTNYLTGINDNGQITGVGQAPQVGFVYNQQTQEFSAVVPPKGNAYPNGINDNGEIGGYFLYANGRSEAGFVVVGSRFGVISPGHTAQAEVFGVTATGTLFGSAVNVNGKFFYFSYTQGKYSDFTIPNLATYAVTGVTPKGTTLVGWYVPSSGGIVGFTYQNKTLSSLQFPGANLTYAQGINDAGEVVGYFYDSQGVSHGFTWTPPADAAKK